MGRVIEPRPEWLTILAFCSVVLFVGSPAAAQDEMSFGVEESKPRAYVAILDEAGLDKKSRAAIVDRLNDFVGGHGIWEVMYEADLKRSADKKAYKSFGKCKDVPCVLEHCRQFGLERVFIAHFVREREGTTAMDIELDDVVTGRVLNYTVAVTDDPSNLTFLDGPMEELLNGQNEVGEAAFVAQGGPTGNGGGGEFEEPEAPSEPFVLPRSWAYYTWGGAGAILVTGAVYGFLATSTQGEIQDGFHTRAELDQLIKDGESSQSIANILFISGLGVAALGGILYWLGEDEPDPNEPKGRLFGDRSGGLDLHLAPTGVGVSVHY